MRFLILSFAFVVNFVFGLDNEIDVLDNDLAKVCHPVDRALDLLFILDGSGSVGGNTFDTQIKMLNRIIDLIDIGEEKTRIAVIQYASYTYTEFLFNTFKDKSAMREAVQKIHHKLGTTKTGKALAKAWNLFNDVSSGSRQRRNNVGQVAIVVTDGHSHDDPIPAAIRLRESGVHLIALGIGSHINEGELLQITGDQELAFNDLTVPESVDQFTNAFKKLAIGEKCEFSRGAEGAEIVCHPESISISVTTRNPLMGHFYVENHFNESACRWDGKNANVSSIGHEIGLSIGLKDCGVERQFSVNPKGFFFETNVVLQFHPKYGTPKDKVFKTQCFYPDKSDPSEIDWKMIREHTQRKAKRDEKALPCHLVIERNDSNISTIRDCANDRGSFQLGDKLLYKWECNSDNFDTYQSVLVHSCALVNVVNKREEIIIDRNGCSVEPMLIETPEYSNSLNAISRGVAIRQTDGPLVKMRCSMKFCDRLMGECETLLPPKCNPNPRDRRQSGFPVSIKALGNYGDRTPLIVTFDRNKLEKNKLIKRRRLDLIPDGINDNENSSISENARHTTVASTSSMDIKLSTQNVRVVDNLVVAAEKTEKLLKSPKEGNAEDEEERIDYGGSGNEEDDGPVPAADESKKAVSEDPFQGEIKRYGGVSQDVDTSLIPELNLSLIELFSSNEIMVESQTIHVHNQKTQC